MRGHTRIIFASGIAFLVGLNIGRSLSSTASYFPSPLATPPSILPQRYAVANFVDDDAKQQLYGVYSIHQQLIKYNMMTRQHQLNINGTEKVVDSSRGDRRVEVTHVAVVSSTLSSEYKDVLAEWLGEDNVRTFDKKNIRLRAGMWAGVFNKLSFFNLTEFDKVIGLDADVLIRSNIMHWFEYETPCAIIAADDINWNSGAMVIKPNTHLFEDMLNQLPNVQRYDSEKVYKQDPLSNGYGQQGVLNAFFFFHEGLSHARTRCVMPTEAAVLSSTLEHSSNFDYYNKYHPEIYQTVHFTTHKPWTPNFSTEHPFICLLLHEWSVSVAGIEKYKGRIPRLRKDYLKKCPKKSDDLDNSTQTSAATDIKPTSTLNPIKWWPKLNGTMMHCVHSEEYPDDAKNEGVLFDSEVACCAKYCAGGS